MERLTLEEALARAEACLRAGRIEEARRLWRAAIRACPDDARVRQALAELDRRASQAPAPEAVERLLALCRDGAFEAAVAEGEALVAAFPGSLALWTAFGGACARSGRAPRAEAAFRRAIALAPELPGGHYNLGVVLHETGRLREAVSAYRKALRRKPDHVGALNNLGNALADLGRPEAAEARFRRALALRPGFADALSNLGRALKDQGRLEEAIGVWTEALRHAPDHAAARVQKLRAQWQICDFDAHAEFARHHGTLGIDGAKVPPFALLPADDDPALQRLRSERWARDFTPAPPLARPRPPRRAERLRIGYFSADLHDHPTLRLASGLMAMHDRARFDVRVYSYGRRRGGALQEQLRRDVPDFHDVEHLPPGQIAELARSHRLDIAIDLNGYTRDARTQIFAARPAAIAVSFLGFPSTMGAAFIDYLVADPIVVPEAERVHYAESILYLPGPWMPFDDRRPRPERAGTRADHGLPEAGFVFCCFNNAVKIGPREFDIWMRLLRQVPGSVLWLLRSNAAMARNLRREAAARGVDPARLVLAEKVAHAAHLARHGHADLFLDTFHYNAHTTASDALRMGVPLVTKAGRQFAARVGASLLGAAGLPDLVTETEADYAALALDLARDPARLRAVRRRLSQGAGAQPLFDTAGYTRDFEAALAAAHARHLRGERPGDIRLPGPSRG